MIALHYSSFDVARQPRVWGAISGGHLRFRFGLVKMNNHGSFGMRRQVAALHIGLVICPSFARIPQQKLTPTSNCTLLKQAAGGIPACRAGKARENPLPAASFAVVDSRQPPEGR